MARNSSIYISSSRHGAALGRVLWITVVTLALSGCSQAKDTSASDNFLVWYIYTGQYMSRPACYDATNVNPGFAETLSAVHGENLTGCSPNAWILTVSPCASVSATIYSNYCVSLTKTLLAQSTSAGIATSINGAVGCMNQPNQQILVRATGTGTFTSTFN